MPFTEGLEATEMAVSRFPDTRVIVTGLPSTPCGKAHQKIA
jgi:hypothetical protein